MSTAGKKILLMAPQPFFSARGTPLNVREILLTLSAAGYQVDCLVYPFGSDIEIPNVRLIRSGRFPFVRSIPIGPSFAKILLDFPYLFKALWLGITGGYDLFHGIEEAGFFAGILGMLRKKPYIFDLDSSMHDQLQESGFLKSKLLLKAFTAAEGFFIRRSTAVVTVCQALSDEILKLAPAANIHQIEDFPLESDGPAASPVLDLRRRCGISDEHTLVLYMGNFEPYQGVDTLLDGYADYIKSRLDANEQINCHLALVGGGDLRLEATKHRAELLGLSKYATFTGPVPPEVSSAVLAQADVLVSSRISGTNTPLKIYSYMQAGKPIIATDIYSHRQVLDSRSAILAAPNRGGFAAALAQALDPSAEARRRSRELGLAAKELVETRYSRKVFRDGFTELYRSVLVNG